VQDRQRQRKNSQGRRQRAIAPPRRCRYSESRRARRRRRQAERLETMTGYGALTRRSALLAALGTVAALRAAQVGDAQAGEAQAADEPQADAAGLVREDWFLQSTLDLAADLALASGRNKRLAVLWEAKGNPLCAETHIKTLGDATIAAYIHTRFEIVQFDAAGGREVIDFDGAKVPENALAAKYGVRMMPTLQFFPETVEAMAGKPPRQREIARLQGYVEPRHMLAVSRFVAEKAYETTTLRDFLRALQI
jgi:thioredoxin-related protein